MKIKIGINGLGRIGRSLLRQLINNHEIEIKLIYDINPDVENICYMINYDSIYGNLDDKFKQINKNLKIFLQVNIGDEDQKAGINKNELKLLVNYCKEINLHLIGLMCIPPANINPEVYFDEMKKLNRSFGFEELSMGMSSDFITAAKYESTFIRVGSSIFGQRF